MRVPLHVPFTGIPPAAAWVLPACQHAKRRRQIRRVNRLPLCTTYIAGEETSAAATRARELRLEASSSAMVTPCGRCSWWG